MKSFPKIYQRGIHIHVLINILVCPYSGFGLDKENTLYGTTHRGFRNELVEVRLPGGLKLQGLWPSENRPHNGNREVLTHVLQMGEEVALRGGHCEREAGGHRRPGHRQEQVMRKRRGGGPAVLRRCCARPWTRDSRNTRMR